VQSLLLHRLHKLPTAALFINACDCESPLDSLQPGDKLYAIAEKSYSLAMLTSLTVRRCLQQLDGEGAAPVSYIAEVDIDIPLRTISSIDFFASMHEDVTG
jgi:hypothetical protein